MKKLLILLFVLISFDTFAVEKETTFTSEVFNEAQKAGKTVVINSWNKICSTCSAQINVLQEAEKEFNDVLFLSFEQTKDKDIAKFLNIDFWTTIVVYKNNAEVTRSIGQTDKSSIYSTIKKGI
jgi:thiol-disulfide isomerase/thioredoxin